MKEEHWAADNASYSELHTGLRAPNSAGCRVVNAAQYVSRLIRSMYWSMTKVAIWLMAVTAKETRRNRRAMDKSNRMGR